MPRILAVDDEASITFFVEEVLREEGYEVTVTNDGADALGLADEIAARGETIDLVISDVNMPRMNGFELRAALRARPHTARTPILFMSGADPTAEQSIARSLGEDRLLLKPAPSAELLRMVRVCLGSARTDRGPVPDVLDRVLETIAAGEETGIFTAVRGPTLKRFVFLAGRLAFGGSNDPRDLIGQAMLRAGVLREKDLLQAFALGPPNPAAAGKTPALAQALEALRMLTPAQCDQVFSGKIRESLLDLYLWEDGVGEFVAGKIGVSEAPFPISLVLLPIRQEGAKRRTRWAAAREILPDPDEKLERIGKWPTGFPKNTGDQHLARLIERGLSFAEMQLELRGQGYALGIRIADLIAAGAVRPAESSGFSGLAAAEPDQEELERARIELELEHRVASEAGSPAPKIPVPAVPPAASVTIGTPREGQSPTAAILSHALSRFRAGELPAARDAFLDVLTIDPMNALARQRLHEVEQALASRSRQSGLENETEVMLAVPIQELVGQKLAPGDAFVLSRLAAGPLSVQDLLVLCPRSAHDVLSVLERFLASGILRRRDS